MGTRRLFKSLETCTMLGFICVLVPMVDLVDHRYLSEMKSQVWNMSTAALAPPEITTSVLRALTTTNPVTTIPSHQPLVGKNNHSLNSASTMSATKIVETLSMTGDLRNKSDEITNNTRQDDTQPLVRNRRLLARAEPLNFQSGSLRGAASEPYFDSNQTTIHITAKAGDNVSLDCTVIMLHGRTVSWLRKRDENLQLITVGNATYYNDPRLILQFRYPENWRLSITSLRKQDEGEYHCQVSTHPAKTLIYHLMITSPMVVIQDEHGHLVTERHYKVDSSLHLTCKATNTDQFEEKVSWLKGDRPLKPGTDNRIKMKVRKGEELGEAFIQLSILWLQTGDSGGYSCKVGSYSKYTVTVHVVNGELPAAVQRGEGEAIRLTVSLSRIVFCLLALIMIV